MSKKKKKLSLDLRPKNLPLPPFMIGSTKAKFLGHNVKFDTYKDQQSVSDVRLTKDWGKLKFLEDNSFEEVAREYQFEGISGDSLFLRINK